MIYDLGERRMELLGNGHYIAPSASVIGSVRLRPNSSVWFNAVLRGDNDWIDIGEMSNVQDGSVLHTDPGIPLTVGAGVTIGHMAMLHGCIVGDGSLIGIGATILNRAKIGASSIVGAGALVTEGKEFPDGVLLLGSPAKVARELEPKEIDFLGVSARVYVENARRFQDTLAARDQT
ncbi:MAG: gamma carbonic anhydrase family protein [Gammaproteobacteria bacterium]|nr:gamma carbonic anhydrase family protein [Gammaproteobacteria bacterium]